LRCKSKINITIDKKLKEELIEIKIKNGGINISNICEKALKLFLSQYKEYGRM